MLTRILSYSISVFVGQSVLKYQYLYLRQFLEEDEDNTILNSVCDSRIIYNLLKTKMLTSEILLHHLFSIWVAMPYDGLCFFKTLVVKTRFATADGRMVLTIPLLKTEYTFILTNRSKLCFSGL